MPQPSVGSILYVSEYRNFTLTCKAFGIGNVPSILWSFNNTFGEVLYFYGIQEEYTDETCQKTSFLIKRNISLADSGVYTCYAGSYDDSEQVEVVVILSKEGK